MPFYIKKYGSDEHYEKIEKEAGYHSDGIIMSFLGLLVVLIGFLSRRPVFAASGAVLLLFGCILVIKDFIRGRIPHQ
jgi:hypothetical protein